MFVDANRFHQEAAFQAGSAAFACTGQPIL
jgi:hypothetical protein